MWFRLGFWLARSSRWALSGCFAGLWQAVGRVWLRRLAACSAGLLPLAVGWGRGWGRGCRPRPVTAAVLRILICLYIRSGTLPSSAVRRRSDTSRCRCHRNGAERRGSRHRPRLSAGRHLHSRDCRHLQGHLIRDRPRRAFGWNLSDYYPFRPESNQPKPKAP